MELHSDCMHYSGAIFLSLIGTYNSGVFVLVGEYQFLCVSVQVPVPVRFFPSSIICVTTNHRLYV